MSKQSLFRNAEPSAWPCFPLGSSLGSLQTINEFAFFLPSPSYRYFLSTPDTRAGVPPTSGNSVSRRERAAGRRGGAESPGLQSVPIATGGPLPAQTLPTHRPSTLAHHSSARTHTCPRSKGPVLVCRLPEQRIRVLRAGPPRSR